MIFKVLLTIILITSIGFNVLLLSFQPNYDRQILDIADNSYFLGCMEASTDDFIYLQDIDNCHYKSDLYRKDFREVTGMEDSTK